MKAFVIRFSSELYGVGSAEIVADDLDTAVEDFERRFPDCEIIVKYEKPFKHLEVGK